MNNKYIYWVLCIIIGGTSTYQGMSYWYHPKPIPVKIDALVDFRTHSLDEQLTWALCFIDIKSSDIRDTGQEFSCPDPKFAKNWFDVVVNEMHKSDLPEMKYCSIRSDLNNIVVVIGEAFYVNVTRPNQLDIKQENALPYTTKQICSKLYNNTDGISF